MILLSISKRANRARQILSIRVTSKVGLSFRLKFFFDETIKMLFLTNKKETYEYAIRHSSGMVKTLRSFIKERHILEIILNIINEYRR